MAVNFRPLHDRVLVRRVGSDEKSAGGIIIPDSAQEKPQEGEIIAVGGGRIDDNGGVHALDVAAGDMILFVPARHHRKVWIGEHWNVRRKISEIFSAPFPSRHQPIIKHHSLLKPRLCQSMTKAGVYP